MKTISFYLEGYFSLTLSIVLPTATMQAYASTTSSNEQK